MSARQLVLESTAHSAASPERVWAVFADARRWPEWSRVVAEVSAAPELWQPGERLAFALRMGATVRFDVRIDACEPGHMVRWSSVRWTVTGTRTQRFDPLDGGTRIVDRKEFVHAWAPLAWIYPRALITRMSRAWVAELAAEAERAT